MDFDSFLELAWAEHAEQAAAVAGRLAGAAALALLQDETQLRSLAVLAQHVHGAHLARWAERRLMLQAAQVGRQYWARAGSWLETERAEYRLARSWLKAGDAAQAQRHARLCLDLVRTNHGPALERLLAWEALGCAARAAGDAAGHAAALAEAQAAYAALDESDRSWCLASVQALALPAPASAH